MGAKCLIDVQPKVEDYLKPIESREFNTAGGGRHETPSLFRQFAAATSFNKIIDESSNRGILIGSVNNTH